MGSCSHGPCDIPQHRGKQRERYTLQVRVSCDPWLDSAPNGCIILGIYTQSCLCKSWNLTPVKAVSLSPIGMTCERLANPGPQRRETLHRPQNCASYRARVTLTEFHDQRRSQKKTAAFSAMPSFSQTAWPGSVVTLAHCFAARSPAFYIAVPVREAVKAMEFIGRRRGVIF